MEEAYSHFWFSYDWEDLKGTGSRLSGCSLIKLPFFNFLLILSVNNLIHMYLSDLRIYFRVELYFRVTWSKMEEYQNSREN